MIREALKLAAVNALRGVLLKFVVPVAAVLVLVGGLIWWSCGRDFRRHRLRRSRR